MGRWGFLQSTQQFRELTACKLGAMPNPSIRIRMLRPSLYVNSVSVLAIRCASIVLTFLLLVGSAEPGLSQSSRDLSLDEGRLLNCLQEAERDNVSTSNEDVANKCALIEARRCIDSSAISGASPASIVTMNCVNAERNAWGRLLQHAYESALTKLSEHDASRERNVVKLEPLLPMFEQAHRSWEMLVESDCAFARQASEPGTEALYAFDLCSLRKMAKRAYYYRAPLTRWRS